MQCIVTHTALRGPSAPGWSGWRRRRRTRQTFTRKWSRWEKWPKKSEQIGQITKSLHIFSLGEGTGKREAFWWKPRLSRPRCSTAQVPWRVQACFRPLALGWKAPAGGSRLSGFRTSRLRSSCPDQVGKDQDEPDWESWHQIPGKRGCSEVDPEQHPIHGGSRGEGCLPRSTGGAGEAEERAGGAWQAEQQRGERSDLKHILIQKLRFTGSWGGWRATSGGGRVQGEPTGGRRPSPGRDSLTRWWVAFFFAKMVGRQYNSIGDLLIRVMKRHDNFLQFRNFLSILTFFENCRFFWTILTILIPMDNFDKVWQLWQFFKFLTFFLHLLHLWASFIFFDNFEMFWPLVFFDLMMGCFFSLTRWGVAFFLDLAITSTPGLVRICWPEKARNRNQECRGRE